MIWRGLATILATPIGDAQVTSSKGPGTLTIIRRIYFTGTLEGVRYLVYGH